MAAKIICGVDASEAARDVASVAASLARQLECQLVLLHAVARPTGIVPVLRPSWHPRDFNGQASVEAGRRLLERLANELGLAAFAQLRVEVGDASTVLLDLAEDEAAELIVVGTRGRGPLAATLFGSVSSAAVSHAVCPVVVVPRRTRLGSGPLLCAVDDSDAARSALRAARRLSARLGVDLVLAHAVALTPVPSASVIPDAHAELAELERDQAEELLARLATESGVRARVERRVAFGSEAETLARLAGEEDATLIAIGGRGHGLRSALTGSVSHDLAAISPTPVLVVPA